MTIHTVYQSTQMLQVCMGSLLVLSPYSCQDFQLENKQLNAELKNTNEQLLIVVQQKFKLQQQDMEEWQVRNNFKLHI